MCAGRCDPISINSDSETLNRYVEQVKRAAIPYLLYGEVAKWYIRQYDDHGDDHGCYTLTVREGEVPSMMVGPESVTLFGHSYEIRCPFCGHIKKMPPGYGKHASYDGMSYNVTCALCQGKYEFTIHINVTFTSKRHVPTFGEVLKGMIEDDGQHTDQSTPVSS